MAFEGGAEQNQIALPRSSVHCSDTTGNGVAGELAHKMAADMPEFLSPEALRRKEIALHLQGRRQQIISKWIQAVSEDDKIPSADELTFDSLKDHLPEMLSELISAIAEGRIDLVDGQTLQSGEDHGKARWRDGYRLDEVLRELARMRGMIRKELETFCEGRFSRTVCAETIQAMEHFFDIIVGTSASRFVKAQEAELALRVLQLQHAAVQMGAMSERPLVGESHWRLLRAVTHELRNSLQTVAFASPCLLENLEEVSRAEIRDFLVEAGNRLQALLDRLRGISPILAGEAGVRAQRIDLNELLHELDREYRPAVEGKGLHFECGLSDCPEIISDQDKLHEIGANLLSNAVEYTNSGFIRLQMGGTGPDHWALQVTDSGRGINSDGAKHIFSEIHPTDSLAHPGMRLGLVISRHLAHLLGGEITFRSKPSAGTRFEATFPRLPR
ncbi:MAG: sensor histidine kinase [Chthoniobacter sp.]